MPSHFKYFSVVLFVISAVLLTSVAASAQSLLPPTASTVANDIDIIFWAILGITTFFFVLVFVVLIYFMIKYRAKQPGEEGVNFHGHVGLEIAWTIVPAIIFVVIAYFSADVLNNLDNPPEDSLVIGVEGLQFGWNFTLPANTEAGFVQSSGELHVPVNEPVRLEISSRDVLHSFWVPAFRLKQDALPNEIRQLWFEATKEGTYPVICAELCGISHSDMLAKVVVESRDEYDAWVQGLVDDLSGLSPAASRGRDLASQTGCMACHSIDGSAVVGPSWLNLYGKMETLDDGSTVEVDEAYLMQSIREPNSQVVEGFFANVMQAYGTDQLSDEEVNDIIEYIKSLSE